MLISGNELIWGSVDQTKDVYNFMELKGRVDAAQATGMESKRANSTKLHQGVALRRARNGETKSKDNSGVSKSDQCFSASFFNQQSRTFYKTFFKGVYFESHHKVIFSHFVI